MEPLGFGTATSSYQIEGAVDEDGRGPSIWDTFCRQPGAVQDDSDGATACDSYHRLDEDLGLLTELGVSAYRFSIAWSRVQPTGSGPVEPRGLDYYERLVDGLLERGIRPFPTLYHWDLPQPLEDAGGWPVRDTALRFADYAAVAADRLGDRVPAWATMNEPWCSAFLGYSAGVHAPGRRSPEAAFAAAHHLLLGHALGREAIRSVLPQAQVGIVLNLAPVWLEQDGDPVARDVVDEVQNLLWTQPLGQGSYPPLVSARSASLQDDALVQPGDLAAVHGSADWVGVNYYTPYRIGAGDRRSSLHPHAPPFGYVTYGALTDMGWEVEPTGLTEVLLTTAQQLPGIPLRVTENGAAYPDDGTDDDRIDYLRRHLAAVESARAQGAPVLDYFAWSLLDNFEWAYGYTKKFGLVSIDLETFVRTPKASFRWYADRIRQAD